MEGNLSMSTAKAVAYYADLADKTWLAKPESTRQLALYMADGLEDETDAEMRVEKAKILLDFLKEETESQKGFRIEYQDLGDIVVGELEWRGFHNLNRFVKIAFTGNEATLEFCTGTGRYSNFLELPERGE